MTTCLKSTRIWDFSIWLSHFFSILILHQDINSHLDNKPFSFVIWRNLLWISDELAVFALAFCHQRKLADRLSLCIAAGCWDLVDMASINLTVCHCLFMAGAANAQGDRLPESKCRLGNALQIVPPAPSPHPVFVLNTSFVPIHWYSLPPTTSLESEPVQYHHLRHQDT